MDNDVTVAHAFDKARECDERYLITSTSFLDMSERHTVESAISKSHVRHIFFGGYEDAERTVCLFLPDYIDDAISFFGENPDECPLCVIRCKFSAGSPSLSHRDYLGSLMGIGVKREKIGDIVVCHDGADIVILRDIEKFLLNEYVSAGRVRLDVSSLPISSLRLPMQNVKHERGSVASLRLDNIISEAFSLSREKASEAITSGIVFVNDAKIQKSDAKIAEGSKLVLRGRGKVILRKIEGETRRGRIAITLDKFI